MQGYNNTCHIPPQWLTMMLASNICLHLQQFGDNAAVKDITRTIVEAGGKTVVALLACAREHQLVKSPKVRSYKQDHLLVDPRERRGRGKKRGRWTFGFARRRRSHALQFAIPFFLHISLLPVSYCVFCHVCCFFNHALHPSSFPVRRYPHLHILALQASWVIEITLPRF